MPFFVSHQQENGAIVILKHELEQLDDLDTSYHCRKDQRMLIVYTKVKVLKNRVMFKNCVFVVTCESFTAHRKVFCILLTAIQGVLKKRSSSLEFRSQNEYCSKTSTSMFVSKLIHSAFLWWIICKIWEKGC